MPKQTLNLINFAGGLNQLNDPRDIEANGFSELDSVALDDSGRIKTSGGVILCGAGTGYAADYSQDTSAMTDKQLGGMIHPGYGLFQTRSDNTLVYAINNISDYKKIRNNVVASEAISQVQNVITFLGNGHTGSVVQNKIAVYDHNKDFWHLTGVNLKNGTVATDKLSQPLMYNIGKGVRLSESNYDLTGGVNQVLMFIDSNQFENVPGHANLGNEYGGWFICDQDISMNPEKANTHAGAIGATTNLIVSNGTSPSNSGNNELEDVNIWFHISDNANAFGWNNTVTGVTWQAAISYIYDDGQESPLKISTTTVSIAAGKQVAFRGYFTANENNTDEHMNPRLTGANVYVKASSASSSQSNSWFLAGEFAFDGTKGAKRPQDDTYNEWDRDSTNYTFFAETDNWSSPPSVETFRTRTGRKPNEAVYARYKCAVEARGKIYIGNVRHAEVADGSDTIYADRMLKSKRVNGKIQPDVFAASETVDLANNDGEQITHLAYFLGKILQFKESTLYIVNVTGAMEALESTHEHMGITHASQVVVTASGVVWVCEKGIMIYNGQSIANLIDNKISIDVWSSFFSVSNVPSIGFDANDAKVIVCKSSIYGGSRDLYIYDVKMKAFSFKKDGFDEAITWHKSYMSNMITDHNGDLVFFYGYSAADDHIIDDGSKMFKWEKDSQPAPYFNVVTKDIDFDQPAIRKKIYKLYITYKCPTATTHVLVQYATNGTGNWKQFGTDTAADMATSYITNSVTYAELDGSKNDWTVAELKPATSSEANNIKSIQLKISGARSIQTGSVTAAGTGYSAGAVTLTGGSGAGAKAIVTVGGSGEITGITNFTGTDASEGTGYALGDVLTVSGGDGAGRITVLALNQVPADFEINDMTIVYRGKNIK